MKVFLIFAVSLFSLTTADDLQTDQQPTEISTGKRDDNGQNNDNSWESETADKICKEARNASVHSVYVTGTNIQVFIESLDGSRVWTSDASSHIWASNIYPTCFPDPNQPGQLGKFRKMDEIPDSRKDDRKFKRVSASFLHYSYVFDQKAYLVLGLTAYEFETGQGLRTASYQPTGNVKPITDFYKEGDQKLLMPEDKLKEVVSVALIKWIKKDQIMDHAIYKIILKTTTKKLVRAFFKLTKWGEVVSLNSEPFVPSAEVMQNEDEFDLLEESALNNVGQQDKLSMGYQFIKSLAFPIYYDYNSATNIYKEYPMRTKQGFNSELEKLVDKIPYWNRFIVPTETWLGCPETTFCLGHSFDAVFFAGNKYYAMFDMLVYTLDQISSSPGVGALLTSLVPKNMLIRYDAVFTIGSTIFFVVGKSVHQMTDIGDKTSKTLSIYDVFPDIDRSVSVSAVIGLNNGEEAGEVTEKIPEPSHLISGSQMKYERAAQTTLNEIPKNMVYVYSSNGIVYQFKMETVEPPKFKLVAEKTYNEVNAALPDSVSLVFTADGKVVTMVHHFMVEQSSQTFFTQTENTAKFTLVNNYFGCHIENLENKLSKDFVQKYIQFAAPKPEVNIFDYPTHTLDTQVSETVSSTLQSEATYGSGAMSSRISMASCIISAVVIIMFDQ